MRLSIEEKADQHTEICTACAWSNGELYTCSDDMQILKWSQDGEMLGKLATVDAYVTSMAWGPAMGKRAASTFACSCTDGTWRIFQITGSNARETKKISAHTGAVISLKWSHDGSSIVTAGEDGDLKVWAPSGNLRFTMAQSAGAVYGFCWGPDGDTVLWCSGKTLNLKSQSGSGPRKALSWLAHEEAVLCLDWNRINELIVSAGEDCVFKVWDAYGRQLYSSPQNAHVVTSISWCPSGECFAVGSFNSFRICDRTGWSYSRERTDSGSIMQIAWTSDGTELAGAGGNGTVVFAQLVQRRLEWQNFEVTLVDPKLIHVQDASIDSYEKLDFPRERVVEMALGRDHLVVATASQCFIYSVTNWNTPHIFDLRAAPQLLVLAENYFLTLESTNMVTVYTYEGRQVSTPRFNGLRPESLNANTVALSNDCVAILDRTDSKTVRCFDVVTGRQLPDTVSHKTEIVQLALSQSEPTLQERRLSIIDRNSDLFITPVVKQPGIFRGMYKLQTQVDTMAWCDTSDMLCAVADGRFVTWYYPNVVFVDRDLISATTESKDATDVGKVSQISGFYGNRATIRKGDGALLTLSVSGYVPKLYTFVKDRRWNEAVRLCRFVKDNKLWGCLAAMAVHGGELETAETALAALGEVDKLQFIQHIKEIPSEQGRNAELALYRRCPAEAEEILLQAKPRLLYRAIKMNIRLFRWTRALNLAEQYKSHVDTVLGYRQKYLEQFGKKETHNKFLQYQDTIAVDWAAIKAKIKQEKDDERARSGSMTGGSGGK